MRFSGTFKGRHRSGAARAEAPLRQAATPRNWLRGRCVEQPVLSNEEIPLSVPEDRPGQVPEDRTVCPLGVQETHVAKRIVPWKRCMKNPTHPGMSVRDHLRTAGLTQTEAARQLGVARTTLARVLTGKAAISPAMALALEDLGWATADFWMRRQAGYQLAQERLRQARSAA